MKALVHRGPGRRPTEARARPLPSPDDGASFSNAVAIGPKGIAP